MIRSVALAALTRLRPGVRVTVTTETAVVPLLVWRVRGTTPDDVSVICFAAPTGVRTEVTLADMIAGTRTFREGWDADAVPRINPAAFVDR